MFTNRGRHVLALLTAATVLGTVAPVDAGTPNTRITSGPADGSVITERSVTFRFSSSARGTTFQCKMDDNAWSRCESPKEYKRLRRGPHLFKVRARKNGVADPTPAKRLFTIDATKPETTITSTPTDETNDLIHVTYDHSPSFEFTSNEVDVTFKCRLTSETFQACSSPFAPAEPLPDGSYLFEVKARDAAGNVDRTPAALAFSILTPITKDQETAEIAAETWFPNAIDLDAPAQCDNPTTIDCPGGNPLPPTDQLRVTSSRSVVEETGSNRYRVTVTSEVVTLEAVTISSSGVECDVTMTSGNGDAPTWQVDTIIYFVIDEVSGDLYIRSGDLRLSGVEQADWTMTGAFFCSSSFVGDSVVEDVYLATLDAHFATVGHSLCAGPGPEYLGPCPPSP